jgi:hypothetical protein
MPAQKGKRESLGFARLQTPVPSLCTSPNARRGPPGLACEGLPPRPRGPASDAVALRRWCAHYTRPSPGDSWAKSSRWEGLHCVAVSRSLHVMKGRAGAGWSVSSLHPSRTSVGSSAPPTAGFIKPPARLAQDRPCWRPSRQDGCSILCELGAPTLLACRSRSVWCLSPLLIIEARSHTTRCKVQFSVPNSFRPSAGFAFALTRC